MSIRSIKTSGAKLPISSVESQLSASGIERGKYGGRRMAVFTSGGDSQGMNATLRAIVRMGLHLGCRVYFIREGYRGMVDGGENFVLANGQSVAGIIHKSGTIIGSARCKEFREREGRLKAAENLVKRCITGLVCIGGDGSLTGVDVLRREWPELVRELVAAGRVDKEVAATCGHLNIVGLVGSIDNDFCGTDMTIGADTALHRIVEAVDAVKATAHSHQRAFVVEVMGRHCGYLALVSGLATEADWIFIPEWPVVENWREAMCTKMECSRKAGQRTNILIVAEGAIDWQGKPITAEMVRKTIGDQLKFDTRITVLGHVQRGGAPSAFDRVLGCRMGAEAVMALMQMNPESQPCVVALGGNKMVCVPLMQCVETTKTAAKAMSEMKFDEAVKLRGHSFQKNLEMYKMLLKMKPPTLEMKTVHGCSTSFNLAVMNVGAPACGMNAAVWSFVRIGLHQSCRVFGIENSFEGLVGGYIKELGWMDVAGWVSEGGSRLGTVRQTPENVLDKVNAALVKHGINGLAIVGGFEAYHSALMMVDRRDQYTSFCIPIVVIPCTISNNVPGTSFALGTDTALNEICAMIDKIKQSASATRRRCFVIETMGGHCGYLATLSALASGADNAYTFEEGVSAKDVLADVDAMKDKMKSNVFRFLITRSEEANENYTTDFIRRLFEEEGKEHFTARADVLGHVQEGGAPSPFDRLFSTKMAARAVEFLVKQASKYRQPNCTVYTKDEESVVLLGLIGRQVEYTPVKQLRTETDFTHRLPKRQWWLPLLPLLRILAKHESGDDQKGTNVTK